MKIAQSKKIGIKEVLVKEKLFTKEDIDDLLEPYNITKPGVIKGGS